MGISFPGLHSSKLKEMRQWQSPCLGSSSFVERWDSHGEVEASRYTLHSILYVSNIKKNLPLLVEGVRVSEKQTFKRVIRPHSWDSFWKLEWSGSLCKRRTKLILLCFTMRLQGIPYSNITFFMKMYGLNNFPLCTLHYCWNVTQIASGCARNTWRWKSKLGLFCVVLQEFKHFCM